MAGAGRLTAKRGEVRDEVEELLAVLARVIRDAEEVEIRVEQAMRRSAVVGSVLGPGLERIKLIRGGMVQVQEYMTRAWREGQARRWKDEG